METDIGNLLENQLLHPNRRQAVGIVGKITYNSCYFILDFEFHQKFSNNITNSLPIHISSNYIRTNQFECGTTQSAIEYSYESRRRDSY